LVLTLIGAYVLTLHCRRTHLLKVGRLGEIKVRSGYYAYVGSAFGRNLTIESRLKRHRSVKSENTQRLHWHIDYLLADSEVDLLTALPVEAQRRVECKISKRIWEIADAVIANFGSSDCRDGCKGHLYYFKAQPLKRIAVACSELTRAASL